MRAFGRSADRRVPLQPTDASARAPSSKPAAASAFSISTPSRRSSAKRAFSPEPKTLDFTESSADSGPPNPQGRSRKQGRSSPSSVRIDWASRASAGHASLHTHEPEFGRTRIGLGPHPNQFLGYAEQ